MATALTSAYPRRLNSVRSGCHWERAPGRGRRGGQPGRLICGRGWPCVACRRRRRHRLQLGDVSQCVRTAGGKNGCGRKGDWKGVRPRGRERLVPRAARIVLVGSLLFCHDERLLARSHFRLHTFSSSVCPSSGREHWDQQFSVLAVNCQLFSVRICRAASMAATRVWCAARSPRGGASRCGHGRARGVPASGARGPAPWRRAPPRVHASQLVLCDVAKMVDDAKSLRWMQSTWAGVNAIFVESQKRDYALTRLGGCFGTQMAAPRSHKQARGWECVWLRFGRTWCSTGMQQWTW